MAKFFETSEDILELAQNKFEDTNLPQMGVNLRVVSTTKAREVLKVGKESAKTEWLTKENDLCTLIIYEEAFDRLNDEAKERLMEGVLSNVGYDSEKGKIVLDNSRYGEILRMRQKYKNYVDLVEAAELCIEQIADEERERKEAEKEAKAKKQ